MATRGNMRGSAQPLPGRRLINQIMPGGKKNGRPMGVRDGQGLEKPQPFDPSLGEATKNPAMRDLLGGIGGQIQGPSAGPGDRSPVDPSRGEGGLPNMIQRFEMPKDMDWSKVQIGPPGYQGDRQLDRPGQGSPQPGLGGIGLPQPGPDLRNPEVHNPQMIQNLERMRAIGQPQVQPPQMGGGRIQPSPDMPPWFKPQERRTPGGYGRSFV